MEQKELIDRMKEKAGLVQAVVSTAACMEDVLDYAVEVTLRQNGKTIAAPGLDPESRQTLETLCNTRGIRLLSPPFKDHVSGIHTALTVADRAIAETGAMSISGPSV